MATKEQHAEFDRVGMIRLPGAIAAGDANQMCDRVWATLLRNYQIRRDVPDSWGSRRVMGTHDLPDSETFAEIGSLAVCEMLDDFLGRGKWQRPQRWASLLVTFPDSRKRWDVPHQAWHLDYPAVRSIQGLFAVRLFTCLSTLPPGAGGTVFVAGSHRLVESLVRKDGVDRLRSADARKMMIRNCAWMKALCSIDNNNVDRIQQFMNRSTSFDDVELRVVEMTGEPGDVLLTHPLLLHAPATNCASVPRMVLSSTIFRSDVPMSALYR